MSGKYKSGQQCGSTEKVAMFVARNSRTIWLSQKFLWDSHSQRCNKTCKVNRNPVDSVWRNVHSKWTRCSSSLSLALAGNDAVCSLCVFYYHTKPLQYLILLPPLQKSRSFLSSSYFSLTSDRDERHLIFYSLSSRLEVCDKNVHSLSVFHLCVLLLTIFRTSAVFPNIIS